MAERIGFISFTAFELQRANEFDSIKMRTYDSSKPARSFFDDHAPQPPWRQLTSTREAMVHKTPAELRPLMNEYWTYFQSKAIQHEQYIRWFRRHHAWNREEEIFLLRFDDLRNHLADIYNRETYAQLGRMKNIFQKAAQKGWEDTQINQVVSEQAHRETHRVTNFGIQQTYKRSQVARFEQVMQPDNKRLLQRAEESARVTGEQETRELLHSPHKQPPKWAKLLAVADYAQRAQMPIADIKPQQMPDTNRPPVMEAPPTLKLGKL
ncbi:MAG: hypothetical protein H7318_09480 [Oligoflexus sp.]|nr:hypothetical protein [Oligoflexus sp.]